jgi:hypothetical protein
MGPLMALSVQRKFVTPGPDETIEELAARALPNEADAVDKIKSWNLHVFAMRRPAGLLLGSDIVFVEAPRKSVTAN